jgi:hypothetical protein
VKRLITFTNSLQPPLNKGFVLLILAVLFIPHWLSSYHQIQTSIGPDLLLRTVGSRLLEAGKPAYQYKWQLGDPISWLNPYPDTRRSLNGVVSSPFLLWLLKPLANLDYCTIRMIWGLIQELLLFFTTWFCCITIQRKLLQIVFISVAIIFFVYDRNWLLNIYNGQVYITYAFIFSIIGYSYSRNKGGYGIISLLTIVSTIRPFFITGIIPFFKFKKRYFVFLISTAVITLIMVFSVTSINEWQQYNSAMKMYAKEETGNLAIDTISPSLSRQYADACTINAEKSFAVFGGGCLYSLQHYLQLFHISINDVRVYELILLCILLCAWYTAYKKDWLQDSGKQLLLSFLFYELCELITPASRNPYNMIQWLPAVAWLIGRGNKQVLGFLIVGLCLNHDIPFRFKYQRELGELLMLFGLALCLFQRNEVSVKQTG